jgi:predicted metal-dependent phosphoesterase TrpH
MNSKVDLHMHTVVSDGTDTIPELLKKIQTLGITTFAVTDHDAIDGALEMECIVPAEIKFIKGVELSCKTDVAKCHILGYNYDPNHAAFRKFVEEANDVRMNKTERRWKYLTEELGFAFSEEEKAELFKKKSPGKPAFAELIQKHLPPVQPGEEPIDIYKKYFENFPGGRVDAIGAIKAVKAAGGIVVWAHPFGGTREKRLTEKQFRNQLELLCNAGIDGLECYYSEYTVDEVETLRSAASEKGLRISGGSDYHGTGKPHLHLGMLNKDDAIIQEELLTVLDMWR